MRTRHNRLLSSVQPTALCFKPPWVRHSGADDFTCWNCSEIRLPERKALASFDAIFDAFKQKERTKLRPQLIEPALAALKPPATLGGNR